jgi:hypothetical protein
MARGATLLSLVDAFRAETRQSTQLSVGTDSLPHVKQLLRRTQRLLYEKHFWSFLSNIASKNIVAGDRYYDAPPELNMDRIERVVVIYNGQPIPIIRGVSFEEYAQYDPEADERSSPVERWDLRWTGSETQIEVWPLPSSSMKLKFLCMRPLRPLVENDDVADLDEDLIVLFAAAEELAAQKSRDADMKLKLAQSHLASLQANAQAGSPMIQMGLGPVGEQEIGRAVVRIGG